MLHLELGGEVGVTSIGRELDEGRLVGGRLRGEEFVE